MKLFAQIVDPNGLTDGLQGYASNFAVVAETDEEAAMYEEHGSLLWARSVEALAEVVGSEKWPYFVPAKNAHCAGWYYDNGEWTDPEASAEAEAEPEA